MISRTLNSLPNPLIPALRLTVSVVSAFMTWILWSPAIPLFPTRPLDWDKRCRFNQNIASVTPKIMYLYYRIIYLLDQSIPKNIYFETSFTDCDLYMVTPVFLNNMCLIYFKGVCYFEKHGYDQNLKPIESTNWDGIGTDWEGP